MTIGERVKQKRLELNMSQLALAKAIGIKQQSVCDLEMGKIEKPRDIVAYANVLGCSAEWLYFGDK